MSRNESLTQTGRITIRSCATALLLACLAPPATAKHYNNSAIPKAQSARAAGGDRVPEGLSASDWSSIRAAYEARRHAAIAVDGGYQARNPGQGWLTRFDGRGFLTTPDAGGWSWGLELLSYGRAGTEQAVTAPSCIEADGGRVSYPWDETLTEWYVNDRRGLEHGYTIQRRPVHSQSDRSLKVAARKDAHERGSHELTGETPVPPLQLTLAVRGNLRTRVNGGGRGVTFVDGAGAAVVNYHGLSVLDAGGAVLPAWFEAHGKALVLSVDDRGARYPLTIDPVAQQAYLKASNTDSLDGFGGSVAVSGDTVVVGAAGEDSPATGIDGNQAENAGSNMGAAYVFVRDAAGVWSQQAYLKASNTDQLDLFGKSVAVSGDTVVVGAPREDGIATGVDGNQGNGSPGTLSFNSGAAYVFVRDGASVWSQQAYLKASNTDSDLFGTSVAVSGDTVVVGAFNEDSNATGVNGNQADNSAVKSGAAYVFVRGAGGVWSQQAYLKASNTGANDQFGDSVAVSGNTVVVGAGLEDSNATGVNGNQADNGAFQSGAAYVFVRIGGVWSQQAYLKASSTGAADTFGRSVAVSGDTVVVGAENEDSNATGVDGNQADNSVLSAGAAYVFVRVGASVWSQQAYLKASNPDSFDGFGLSVAVSGDTVVVGAHNESSSATGVDGNQSDNSAGFAGAAYVFVRDGASVWSQRAYLKASNPDSDDRFGVSVAVSGDTVVVGANKEDSSAAGVDGNQGDNSAAEAGAAYVFVLRCGDGILDPGEACDDGIANSDAVPDACRANCTLPTCGDGVVDTGEACDDGNTDDSDGCSATCVSECPVSAAPLPELIGPDVSTKNRFLSFSAGDAGEIQAVRVSFVSLPAPYDLWNGSEMWVGSTSQVNEASADIVPTGGPSFTAAQLQCAPLFTDWSAESTIHVFHEGIVPGGSYLVDVIGEFCDANAPESFSSALPMATSVHGDTVLDLSVDPPPPPGGPPVGINDALAILERFSNALGAIIKARAELEPACLDLTVSVADVLASLSGFSGLGYPFSASAADPCNSTCGNPLP